jgi:hypothetical protein
LTSGKGSSKGKRKSKKAAAGAATAEEDTKSRMRSGNSDDEEAGAGGEGDDDDGDAPGGGAVDDALAPGDIGETAVDQDGEKDIDFDQVCVHCVVHALSVCVHAFVYLHVCIGVGCMCTAYSLQAAYLQCYAVS